MKYEKEITAETVEITPENAAENTAESIEKTRKSTVENPVKTVENQTEKAGIFVYVGPTIRGVIQNGRVFNDTKSGIISGLSPFLETYPEIPKLIVKDHYIITVKNKIKESGNGFAKAFEALKKGG